MIGALFSLAKPALHALDAETAHQLTIRALSLMPVSAPPAGRCRAWRSTCFGRHFPNPVGLAAGFDKQCEVPDQLLGARLRLRRTRRRGAEAAGGQSAPAGVPAAARRGGHQPLRPQQRRPRCGAPAPRQPPRPSGHRRREYRRQQGFGGSHRRLRDLHRAPVRARRFPHHQRVVAEHAGPARPAGRGISRRSARPQHRGARRGRITDGARRRFC